MDTTHPTDPALDVYDQPDRLVEPNLFLFNGRQWTCTICPEVGPLSFQKAKLHEDSSNHVARARRLDSGGLPSEDLLSDPLLTSSPHHAPIQDPSPVSPLPRSSPLPGSSPPDDTTIDAGHLESALPHSSPRFTLHGPALPSDLPHQLYDDHGGIFAQNELHMASRTSMTALYDDGSEGEGDAFTLVVDEQSGSDESDLDYLSDIGHESDGISDTGVDDDIPAAHLDDHGDDAEWWPWRDKKDCLLDLLGAFPRAVFSESELEITRWFATKLGVANLPSVKAVKRRRKRILKVAGSRPALAKGSLGHFYSTTSFAKIIAHEMVNPRVRPHLEFYPDTAQGPQKHFKATHGRRWGEEVDPNLSAPMARAKGQDYFVEEPALVKRALTGAVEPVFVTRFVMREGKMIARGHPMLVANDLSEYVIEGEQCVEIPLEEFLLNFNNFCDGHTRYHLPHPKHINGVHSYTNKGDEIVPLKVDLPNPWRIKANGRPVFGLPFWLYCDDTSGNVSKKWNKHNSFLFILAGLPLDKTLLPYNIHFLSTSNLAPPLEMLEKIIEELLELQSEGLVVTDIDGQEILLILWILAFLGDNPMQSELASHIGLTGKFFCRVCHVCGKSKTRATDIDGEIARVTEFMQTGDPRTKEHTIKKLNEQLDHLMKGVPTRADSTATDSGVKDKHAAPLFESLATTCAAVKEHNRAVHQPESTGLLEAISAVRKNQSFAEIFNPIFRLLGLDPNQDTPVEILHCVLLGVVKYFWRDAVSRQNSAGKQKLKTRLSSLDVSSLGLPPIQANTLVQYAGSLTGRDFRIVLQVAPAVLFGLLPEPAYEAWVALCQLAPLIFQPEISDLNAYLHSLENAIDNFLAATALWNTQWFNKPKFHILLHLPTHIRRFGPAILFATEGFESYNLVIRLRSVHSNRHAPSVDIAEAMSFMHAARHLVSGGLVQAPDQDVRTAGSEVLALANEAQFIRFMGFGNMADDDEISQPSLSHRQEISWNETQANAAGFTTTFLEGPVYTFPSAALHNGDVTHVGNFVIFSINTSEGPLLGRVQEIIGSATTRMATLIQQWSIGEPCMPYRLPSITPTEQVFLVALQNKVCACQSYFHNCAARGEEPNDRVLNLAQLRSAAIIQGFQPAVSYRAAAEAKEAKEAGTSQGDLQAGET